jgi:inorganic pyrophosphatase
VTNLIRIDHRLDDRRRTCRVVIETPRGQRGKLAYDPHAQAFALKRLLPEGMSFPLDFGFVPLTRGQDDDPLDILVVHDEPLPTGALVEVRLIGVLASEQTENGGTIRNDRLIGVTVASHLFARVQRLEDLGETFARNLERFWINYNALRGVDFRVLARRDAQAAVQLITASSWSV